MISKKYIFTCKECGKQIIVDEKNIETLEMATWAAKENGWIIDKEIIKGVKFDFCNEKCYKKYIEKNIN